MGKPSVAGVALIRTAPLASFNAFAALKIDLAFMILGNPITRRGSIPNDNNMSCRDGGRESMRMVN